MFAVTCTLAVGRHCGRWGEQQIEIDVPEGAGGDLEGYIAYTAENELIERLDAAMECDVAFVTLLHYEVHESEED